ncbi:MAG: hypothetical protein D6798_03640 [Deltaproteobacteria bacterium]|nr:MAG: hypothetical protein D6798_03640 [Deltaproteobacteria bacterium]
MTGPHANDGLAAILVEEALEHALEAARRRRWVDVIVMLEDVLQDSARRGQSPNANLLLRLAEAYARAARPGRAADLAASALLVSHGGGASTLTLARRARQALEELARRPVIGACIAEDDPMSEAFVATLRERGLAGPDLRADGSLDNPHAVPSIRALLSRSTTVVVLVGPELLSRSDLVDRLHASLRRTAARVGQPRFTLRSLHDRAASPIERVLPVALPGVPARPFWPDAPWVDARAASPSDAGAAVDAIRTQVAGPA